MEPSFLAVFFLCAMPILVYTIDSADHSYIERECSSSAKKLTFCHWKRTGYCNSRTLYYCNTSASFNIELLRCGDIESNPGPSELKAHISTHNERRKQYTVSELYQLRPINH